MTEILHKGRRRGKVPARSRAAAGVIAGVLALGLGARPALADTQTGTVTVKATLVAACAAVTPVTLDFGNIASIGALAANNDKTTTFQVACSNGAPYTVYLGDGGNRIAGSNRRMANGTALLPYQLYSDTGFSHVWDTTGMGVGVTGGSGGVNGTGNGANQTMTIYGRIASGTVPPATIGAYSDTVVITVAY